MTTKPLKVIYRTLRSILFSAVLVIVGLYALIYVLLSAPWIESKVSKIATRELTALLGGEVKVESLQIYPFNEVAVSGVTLNDPEGRTVAKAEKIACGISLMRLISEHRVVITYAEIIGLDARLWQSAPEAPLNIDYIIKALQSKDPNKPPAHFDVSLRSAVIRRSRFAYDRLWQPVSTDPSRIDFNHLRLIDIKADLSLPRLTNDDFTFDLRRLALSTPQGFSLKRFSLRGHLTPYSLSLEDMRVELPSTSLQPSDILLEFDGYTDIIPALLDRGVEVTLPDNKVTPSDLSAFLPALRPFDIPLQLTLQAECNRSRLVVNRLVLTGSDGGMTVEIKGEASNLSDAGHLKAQLSRLSLYTDNKTLQSLLALARVRHEDIVRVEHVGHIRVEGKSGLDMGAGKAEGKLEILTSLGRADVEGAVSGLGSSSRHIRAEAILDNIEAGLLTGRHELGTVTGAVDADLSIGPGGLNGLEGTADVEVAQLQWKGVDLSNLTVSAHKSGHNIEAKADIDNQWVSLSVETGCVLDGERSQLTLTADVGYLNPVFARLKGALAGSEFSGICALELNGNNIENLWGKVSVSNLNILKGNSKLALDRIDIYAARPVDRYRQVTLTSDWIEAYLNGVFGYRDAAVTFADYLNTAMPSLVRRAPKGISRGDNDLALNVKIRPCNALADFFKLPVRPLDDVEISAELSSARGVGQLSLNAPYLRQGEKKLIQHTSLQAVFDAVDSSAKVSIGTVMPVKKGEMQLKGDIKMQRDSIDIQLGFNPDRDSNFKGAIGLNGVVRRDSADRALTACVNIEPSQFELNQAVWSIDSTHIDYGGKRIEVEGFRLWHDDQYVEIDGVASSSPSDKVNIRLADIDVGFIFDTLDINYVSFGGVATGEIEGVQVLGREPVALTKTLRVEKLAYNEAIIGDADIESHWDNTAKKVAINADISLDGRRRAGVDGGIWLTRDSLSFDIEADHVNVAFLRPFMEAFANDVGGSASGHAKLFGTFSDIDLTGRIKAENTRIRLGFTNVEYFANDSVIFNPGHIRASNVVVRDRYGNTAMVNGELTHRYFHDPRFEFRISEAQSLLVYDINEQMNPDWYGTIFASGNGLVRGWPGVVMISVDMATSRNSAFTFVLSDTQAAGEYNFLSFSDVRKEQQQTEVDTIPEFLKAYRNKGSLPEENPTVVDMDLRMSVNPDALLTIVMDPVAGDKITARGSGSLNLPYNSQTDVLNMYGKYTVEEGTYNFTLQDLILRDFIIKPGSSISFDGDPLNANLDMAAVYRVNTNLSDLDKSFSTDRDLNRTNVPVDAVLKVQGKMTAPNIDFDIELPTLTAEVERKVKSIISTDDQMSRQIIYLLALNRFYTPEYMGGGGNTGSELAAVASSTLSAQLANMIGQLTDKVSLTPAIRSDKGDFSDVEVDLALSSRLLDNRLLVNGNFGYRDRTTSTTTFVGDFDIEYLLSRNGGLRLKAYNHFNDQNYYLRSALTTQGLGVVYRHDFDRMFSFLKRRRKSVASEQDSVAETEITEEEEDEQGDETEEIGDKEDIEEILEPESEKNSSDE